jgi:dolichyl-phosphate beta-glucosyltransferase
VDLSIVIPAHNEAGKISADIAAADAFLHENRLKGEIIVVDDGSSDATAETARRTPVAASNRRFVASYQPRRGKGHAVRTGTAMSTGEMLLFADSGLCVPYACALIGLRWLQEGRCDIAHGSRKLPESKITRSWVWYRKILSGLFRHAARALIRIPASLTDTQCGFKIYRGGVARALYAQCQTDGFMFDIEIIMRAVQKGHTILEFPIQWHADRDSRLSVIRNLRAVTAEMLAIRRMFAE